MRGDDEFRLVEGHHRVEQHEVSEDQDTADILCGDRDRRGVINDNRGVENHRDAHTIMTAKLSGTARENPLRDGAPYGDTTRNA
jgi:hypothetical protein